MTNPPAAAKEAVLEVEDLAISYETRKGDVAAVRGVSLTVNKGETVGIVGESGCGKSTIAFGIVGYLGTNGKVVNGAIRFEGQDLVGRSQADLNRLRGDRISMVYQDPMQALNPSMKLGHQLAEVLTAHRNMTLEKAWEKSVQMLKRVYMPDAENMMQRFPHQLSGGQQQRVVIAMAMLNHPSLLIMDEPTTALDVTVEAAVLDLIMDLKQEYDTGIIFITHNLGVVARVSDNLCVMYAGEMVEKGPIRNIFANPSHPYTKGLLGCVPRLGQSKADAVLRPIHGQVPPPAERNLDACIFHPRCGYADERCKQSRPDYVQMSPDHRARCFFAKQIQAREQKKRKRAKSLFAGEAATAHDQQEVLLDLGQLKVYYEQESDSLAGVFGLGEKRYVKAVDDISFQLIRGKTLGIVGESGCGKSTLVKGLIGLEEVTEGQVEFLGLDVTKPVKERDMSWIREMQMVFQNPDSTLNPSFPVGKQIARPIRRFKTVPRNKVKDEVVRILQAVRLGAYYYDRLPRQLSGGEKQRVGIARALAAQPDLVICDEPVSALDVSVQAAVINLLLEIQRVLGTTMIFIAHDLSVVRYFSDFVAVMYLGRIVEIGPAEQIYAPPYHPYTEALLSAVPIPDPEIEQTHIRLSGNVPSALNPPSGCRFHTRCPRREMMDDPSLCAERPPPWIQLDKEHRILCHLPLAVLERLEPVVQSRVA
ncbi:MAG: ABC transporter ATP-binding protein [Desulfobacterales bacterium]